MWVLNWSGAVLERGGEGVRNEVGFLVCGVWVVQRREGK